MQQLNVVYDGPDIDEALDDALRKVLAEFGWEWWASGYDLVDDERDLAFRKPKTVGATGREAGVRR